MRVPKPPRHLPWIAAWTFVLSPYFLLAVGGFHAPDLYLAVVGLLGAIAVGSIVLSMRLWLLAALPAIVLTQFHALSWFYPCWRYSNAAWCGHFCDDDPCACPERAAGVSPYGAGDGCHEDSRHEP